jgi:CubicO group peptidase (beta-lactamase class C family)
MDVSSPVSAPRLAWRWLVLFFLVAAAAARAGEAPADLSTDLERLRAGGRVPGLVAVVTDESGIVAQGAAGVHVLGGADPMRVDDLMHIGSITKPFTATIVATLVDEGKLRWDSTLAQALPDLAPSMRPEYRAVSLAQLLSHEAGIQPFEDDGSPEFLGIPKLAGDASAQRHQFAAYALSLEPVNPPGSAFRYSNAGFALAAAIAEATSGRSWEELLRDRLFVPLGMSTAGSGWPNARDSHAPWGHVEENGALRPTPPDDPYQLPLWIAPAGNLSMSLPDLARFARLHLLGFDGKAGILRPETFRTMHTKRLRGGLGWGVSALLGHEPVSTFSGSAGTFLAMIVLVHDSDLAVIVAANSADDAANTAVKGALKELVVRFAGDKTPPTPAN